MQSVDVITGMVVHTAYKIYREVGPGLLESVYETLLCGALSKHGVLVERQKCIPLEFDGIRFDEACRVDLLVAGTVIVELKSTEKLLPVHKKQLLTYLRIAGQPVGLLVNFGAGRFRDAVKRVVNNYPVERTTRLAVPR